LDSYVQEVVPPKILKIFDNYQNFSGTQKILEKSMWKSKKSGKTKKYLAFSEKFEKLLNAKDFVKFS
jgi:hypothetical protein